ncbi:MAG: alanyl aminopeptidase [Saprospiraceae bacterium]|nr:alanyl aminopeptidase [Saprospiraceae bacterium]
MKSLLPILAALLLLTAGCKTTQKSTTLTAPAPVTEDVAIEERSLDTLEVTPDMWDGVAEEETGITAEDYQLTYTLPNYNETARREHDLLHTKLDLRFDWAKEKVLGKATLKLKPYFYPATEVTLDAKGFEFHKVTMEGEGKPLVFDYSGDAITIQLGKTYTRDQTYSLYMEYTATPSATGGSEAITSDKGLFFINPREEEPGKPRQIWTQGETEWNSRWFPTIDKPNERTTQEMYITVEDKFKTLSNGVLLSSKKNNDGTRTDYWKMDLPHAPYLFMMAIGEYAVVKDKWEGIDVDYYVEPAYEKDARAIFPHTPEMLGFFSNKVGVKYPWSKFAQVVVRDYVSGAMENTTAVVFGDFVQRHSRELIDELTNDKIVAHEMFHQWFGDLVTCESWANLTLNEGFANYSEYLWLEHKYGKDAADYHLWEELGGYLDASRSSIHPLIHFGYENKEDMFDAHSYNKGGLVLHMLRNHVGDDAFFAALKLYLNRYQFKAAEVHDLRLAFEEVTGEDLNWFFNQWYLREGHPQLEISYGYEAATGEATVTVAQTQSPDMMPAVFELPVAIDLYFTDGSSKRIQEIMMQREQTFSYKVDRQPAFIIFDAERVILAERKDNKTEAEMVWQYKYGPRFLDRMEALMSVLEGENKDSRSVVKAALKDPFWVLRAASMENLLEEDMDENTVALVRQMAAGDPHSQVRNMAYNKLMEIGDTEAVAIAKTTMQKEQSYYVLATALRLLNQLDKESALPLARQFEKEENSDMLDAVGEVYLSSGDAQYMPFFESRLDKVDGMSAFTFFSGYQSLAVSGSPEVIVAAIDKLKSVGVDMNKTIWQRVAAVRALVEMRGEFLRRSNAEDNDAVKQEIAGQLALVKTALDAAKAVETNADILGIYDQLIGQ